VFCCFNNSYKIVSACFDAWMRILIRMPGSVLWLSDLNPFAKNNLRREAERRGVSAERLVFA
jgi:protein O-GlcNAc transferase